VCSEDIDELKVKRICFACVGEQFLSDEIRSKGKRAKCRYCGNMRRTYSVGDIAKHIQTAFEQHYFRTSDQPDDWEYSLLSDRESNYEWERHGEPVVDAIMNAAEIPEEAAQDIQRILEDEHSDFDCDAIGEETEFAGDSYYEKKQLSAGAWQEGWHRFEKALKTKARFFSRTAATYLESIFSGIEGLLTHDGRPLIVDAGPGTDFHTLFRARVFQSDTNLKTAMGRPDQHLGPPPAPLAAAGRMNAHGISVFYGANNPKAAIAEVRPPVGSQVAVAQFEIIRRLQLLNLTALEAVKVSGSIFDFGFASRLEREQFLRSLTKRITRPVMPDDEPFEYLATQAIADFLATESSSPVDGILFPSVQVAGDVLNVALFHKAARVEAMDIPEGTEIEASTAQLTEDGWERDYSVIEKVPPESKEAGNKEKDHAWPDFDAIAAMPWKAVDSDPREPTLRILGDTIRVHYVKRVVFDTDEFPVQRYRWEKRNPDF
jgi:hypothetical protein